MQIIEPYSLRFIGNALLIFFLATIAIAQPSGGPYGPVLQIYGLPNAAHIYFVAPNGNAEASGTELKQPTTLESAISRVVTGDAIILRGGVYRTGDLRLNQGILMQPYAEEQPILKGTKVVSDAVALRGDVWRIPWKHLFPSKPSIGGCVTARA